MRNPWDEPVEAEAKLPMTAEQAAIWRKTNHAVSPWLVVLIQALATAVLALLLFGLTQKTVWAWSSLYGGACVVISNALFARGMSSKLTRMSLGTAVLGFVFWELVKLAVCVLLLLLASKVLSSVAWTALLLGLIVSLKASWLALLFRSK